MIPPIYSAGSKVIGSVTNSKPIKWTCNKFKNNFDNALAISTIASIVLKDGVGCGMYVYQSLNNKEIPEKRRNFVAALDLTNGILMIVSQIAFFAAMHKFDEPLFDKLFAKSFSKEAKKTIITQTRIIQDKTKTTANGSNNNVSKKLVINKDYDKVKEDSLKIFKFVTELVASTIIAKRVLVPLIATPLANKVEKKMNKKHPETQEHKELEIKDKSNPLMQGSIKTANTNLLDKYKK